MTRDRAVELQAQVLCIIAGFEPVDSLDGSPNWWMFNGEAEKIVDAIQKRFPPRLSWANRSQRRNMRGQFAENENWSDRRAQAALELDEHGNDK